MVSLFVYILGFYVTTYLIDRLDTGPKGENVIYKQVVLGLMWPGLVVILVIESFYRTIFSIFSKKPKK